MPAVARFEEESELLLAAYLTLWMDREALRRTDPVLAAQLIIRTLSGVVRTTLMVDPDRVGDDLFVDELMALIEGYLRPREGGAPA